MKLGGNLYQVLEKDLYKTLKGQYIETFFDIILKTRMTWVKPYCPLIKIYQKDWKIQRRSKKKHIKDNMGQIDETL